MLDVRIDELVLYGFRAADRHAIGEAVQRELAVLFQAGGVPDTLTRPRIGPVDAGSLDLPHDAPPDLVGARIAAAIHRGLVGPPPDRRALGAGRR
jgi:hypothetical protein